MAFLWFRKIGNSHLRRKDSGANNDSSEKADGLASPQNSAFFRSDTLKTRTVYLPIVFIATSLFLLLSTALTSETGGPIVILSSLKISPYQRLADALCRKVGPVKTRVLYLDSDSLAVQHLEEIHPRAIVTVGRDALKIDLPSHGDIPIVFTMVLFPDGLLKTKTHNVHGVSMICSPCTELWILKKGFGFTRVTVFYNPIKTGGCISRFKRMNDAHLDLKTVSISSLQELQEKAPRALDGSSACLLLPDPSILTEQGLKTIIDESFERDVPVVGFSPMYLEIGATITVSVTEEAIADQAIRLLESRKRPGNERNGICFVTKPQVTVNKSLLKRFNIHCDEKYLRKTSDLKWSKTN